MLFARERMPYGESEGITCNILLTQKDYLGRLELKPLTFQGNDQPLWVNLPAPNPKPAGAPSITVFIAYQ